jgi:REP element-mobilizing transposase RayT
MAHFYNITLMLNRAAENRRLHTNTHGQAVRGVIETLAEKHAKIYAWVVMPDHIHLLFSREKPLADVNTFAGRIKRWINKALTMRGLHKMKWREGCVSYPVDMSTLEAAKRHILANPVRADLAENPEDYALAGAPAPLP